MELENKVKSLETEGARMKQNIVDKDNEIKMLKTASEMDYSGVRGNRLLEDQDTLFKKKLSSGKFRYILFI